MHNIMFTVNVRMVMQREFLKGNGPGDARFLVMNEFPTVFHYECTVYQWTLYRTKVKLRK